jgi:hypothetical protein
MDATSNGGSEGQASALELARFAKEAVEELTGFTPESVSGLERRDDTWTIKVDVCELERVPSTTDVIATYEVQLDADGNLLGYRRIRRFMRSDAQEEA